jgi:hypothetical protein
LRSFADPDEIFCRKYQGSCKTNWTPLHKKCWIFKHINVISRQKFSLKALMLDQLCLESNRKTHNNSNRIIKILEMWINTDPIHIQSKDGNNKHFKYIRLQIQFYFKEEFQETKVNKTKILNVYRLQTNPVPESDEAAGRTEGKRMEHWVMERREW